MGLPRKPAWPLVLAFALCLGTPAFYLALEESQAARRAASALYLVMALLCAASWRARASDGRRAGVAHWFDLGLALGALVCAWPTPGAWPPLEWALRLGYSGTVFARLLTLAGRALSGRKPLQLLLLAALLVAVSGAGFLWLEPRVASYADGVWLAFITGATVGYGDLVPSTPAARVLAAFIVLLGYALFSLATARIAALLVGEDERRAQRALHADLSLLRAEIAQLRAELRRTSPPELPPMGTRPPRHSP